MEEERGVGVNVFINFQEKREKIGKKCRENVVSKSQNERVEKWREKRGTTFSLFMREIYFLRLGKFCNSILKC